MVIVAAEPSQMVPLVTPPSPPPLFLHTHAPKRETRKEEQPLIEHIRHATAPHNIGDTSHRRRRRKDSKKKHYLELCVVESRETERDSEIVSFQK